MIQATLVLLPAFDAASFVHPAQSVTGENHLRRTDSKNLDNRTAEVLSIMEDFGGYAEAGHNVVPIGFLFTGTIDQIDKVPTLVGGRYVKATVSASPILSAVLVVATVQEWEAALMKVERLGDDLQRKCFATVARELFRINRNQDLPRLN